MTRALTCAACVTLAAMPPATAQDTVTQPQFLTAKTSEFWPKSSDGITRIKVCFNPDEGFSDEEDSAFRKRVKELIGRTWQANSAIEFQEWKSCTGPRDIEIVYPRVKVSAGIGPAKDGPRLVFLDPKRGPESIVHEFGHALGFRHPFERADTPDFCIGPAPKGSQASLNEFTSWDRDSVMNYCKPPSRQNGELSPLDIRGLIRAYGGNPKNRLGLYEDGDLFGKSLAVGDVDADGHVDVVVGAPGEAIGQEKESGSVFLYRGTELGALRPVAGLTQKGLGKDEEGDRFGSKIILADVDGRPGDEIIVAAPFELIGAGNPVLGALFVFTWPGDRHLGESLRTRGVEPLALIDTRSLGGPHRRLGLAGMAAADLDGDGLNEIYTTASLRGSTELLGYEWRSASRTFALDRRQELGSGLGDARAILAVDIQDSATPEIVLGFPNAPSPSGDPDAGAVVVATWLDNGKPSMKELRQNSFGTALLEGGDQFGWSLAAGDFDGDGRSELAIGAPGEVIGSSGRNHGTVEIWTKCNLSVSRWGAFNQDDIPKNPNESDDKLGSSLTVGDFNGDGFDDLGVGLPEEHIEGVKDKPGYIYVAFGKPKHRKPLENRFDGGNWLAQNPIGTNDKEDDLGAAMAAADLDRDGRMELIAGAPGEALPELPRSGYVFVYRVPDAPLEAWYSFGQQF